MVRRNDPTIDEEALRQAEELLREKKDTLIPPLRTLGQDETETTQEEEQ